MPENDEAAIPRMTPFHCTFWSVIQPVSSDVAKATHSIDMVGCDEAWGNQSYPDSSWSARSLAVLVELRQGSANAIYAEPCGPLLSREPLAAITIYCFPSTI